MKFGWFRTEPEPTTQQMIERFRIDCPKHRYKFEKRLFAGTLWQLRFGCEKCNRPLYVSIHDFHKMLFIEESESDPLYKPEASISRNVVTYEALTPEGMVWATGNSLPQVVHYASSWPGDPEELSYRSKTVRIVESRPIYTRIERPNKEN